MLEMMTVVVEMHPIGPIKIGRCSRSLTLFNTSIMVYYVFPRDIWQFSSVLTKLVG